MKSRIPYLLAAVVASASLLYLADTPGLSAAPLVTLTSTTGQSIDLASPAGKTRLVSFWAPDCPISERDLPGFSHLTAQFADDEFEIVAVAMSYSNTDDIQLHIDDHNIPYAIAHDADGSVSEAFPGVRFTPTTFLIDGNGEIVWRHVGKLNATETAGQITELLQPAQLASN